VRGMRRPSRWMRGVHVMPFWNDEMASLSVAHGSSVQRLEKHCMYSQRLSPGCCLQLRSSHCLPGACRCLRSCRRKPDVGRSSR
jgi:hypothetical protein